MLAWIGLWVWVALADWSLSKHLLAQAWMMTVRLGRNALVPLRHYWHPEYVVRGLAAVLVVLAAIFFRMGMNANDTDKFATTFAPNLATDCLSLAITILVIDQLYRWRDKVYQQRIDESLAAQRKRNIFNRWGA
jgi:hypothetical protein